MADIESDPKVQAFIRAIAPMAGVLVLVGAVGLVTTAARLIISPGHRAPLDNPVGGVVLLGASVWIFVIACRLIGGRRRPDGGVLPPWMIAAGGGFFLLAPLMLFQITRNIHLVLLTAGVWAAVSASAVRVIRSRRSTRDRRSNTQSATSRASTRIGTLTGTISDDL